MTRVVVVVVEKLAVEVEVDVTTVVVVEVVYPVVRTVTLSVARAVTLIVVVEETVEVVEEGGGVSVVFGVTVVIVKMVGRCKVKIDVVVGTLFSDEQPFEVQQTSSVYVVVEAAAFQVKR